MILNGRFTISLLQIILRSVLRHSQDLIVLGVIALLRRSPEHLCYSLLLQNQPNQKQSTKSTKKNLVKTTKLMSNQSTENSYRSTKIRNYKLTDCNLERRRWERCEREGERGIRSNEICGFNQRKRNFGRLRLVQTRSPTKEDSRTFSHQARFFIFISGISIKFNLCIYENCITTFHTLRGANWYLNS